MYIGPSRPPARRRNSETTRQGNVTVTRLPASAPFRAHPRVWLGAAVAIVIIIAVVIVVAIGGGGGSTTPTVAKLPPLHPHRAGPEAMFTPAAELTADPVGTLNTLKRLGVDRIHVFMHWADIAPDPTSSDRPDFDATDPAAYPAAGWASYDADHAGRRGARDRRRPGAGSATPAVGRGQGRTRPHGTSVLASVGHRVR